MSFFKKKKTEAEKLQVEKDNEANDPKVTMIKTQITTSNNPVEKFDKEETESIKVEDPKVSLDQAIVLNTDLWYKTQILALIIDIQERLKKLEK